MIETDAPYLAPVPHRGRANRPELLVHVGEAVAAAKQVPVDAVADATWANAASASTVSSAGRAHAHCGCVTVRASVGQRSVGRPRERTAARKDGNASRLGLARERPPCAAVPLAALTSAERGGGSGFSATEVLTASPSTSAPPVVIEHEAVPARRSLAEPKGVAVVAPPTTTTTAPPAPPTTAAPEPESAPAPSPDPAPVAVTVPPPVRPTPTPPPPPPPAPAGVARTSTRSPNASRVATPTRTTRPATTALSSSPVATWWGLGFWVIPRDYTYNEQKYGANRVQRPATRRGRTAPAASACCSRRLAGC